MIYVIEDDEIMAECVARACSSDKQVMIFSNVYDAMNAIDKKMPDLVFLDVMLDGADGFTFLNELMSYSDTAQIPVVIMTSLDIAMADLSAYGVVGILEKTKMTPQEIAGYVKEYA